MQRNFIIGDKWLYFKIYTGTKTSDRLLSNEIINISEQLTSKEYVDKWFFIRYADPNYHIRLRYQLVNCENIFQVINSINIALKPYVESGMISTVKVDTYKRELERYGEDNMEESETLFHNDSIMVGKVLKLLMGDETNDERSLFCIKSIDRLLNDFRIPEKRRLELLERLKIGFANEFNVDRNVRKQLSKKYSIYKQRIYDQLTQSPRQYTDIELDRFLDERTHRNTYVVDSIMCVKGKINISHDSLLSSYIHMHCNRLFKSKQRLHEMVIYDFLFQSYKSIIARKKYQNKNFKYSTCAYVD
ncbi:MAG: thiopeptide-type bacteriocin biosynthesis protein [Nitrososphaeraceae archaeon]